MQTGGVVTEGRLQGRVEVSRSFGDRAFKRVGMSAAPDLRTFERKQSDRFVLLGCAPLPPGPLRTYPPQSVLVTLLSLC
eukprot:1175738-Prorocentrum_minimum.AAC.7